MSFCLCASLARPTPCSPCEPLLLQCMLPPVLCHPQISLHSFAYYYVVHCSCRTFTGGCLQRGCAVHWQCGTLSIRGPCRQSGINPPSRQQAPGARRLSALAGASSPLLVCAEGSVLQYLPYHPPARTGPHSSSLHGAQHCCGTCIQSSAAPLSCPSRIRTQTPLPPLAQTLLPTLQHEHAKMHMKCMGPHRCRAAPATSRSTRQGRWSGRRACSCRGLGLVTVWGTLAMRGPGARPGARQAVRSSVAVLFPTERRLHAAAGTAGASSSLQRACLQPCESAAHWDWVPTTS